MLARGKKGALGTARFVSIVSLQWIVAKLLQYCHACPQSRRPWWEHSALARQTGSFLFVSRASGRGNPTTLGKIIHER